MSQIRHSILTVVLALLAMSTAHAGTPSFTAPQTFATGTYPYSVAAADMNGDGKPDLIVANNSSNTISVLLNTTAQGTETSSFTAQQTFDTGNSPDSVIAADVNGDGKPDLIVANSLDNTVSVLLNTTPTGASTPSFAKQQVFAVGTNPTSVSLADVNGDGKPDLIVANSASNTVSVLVNTTAQGTSVLSFANQQTFTTGAAPYSVTTADVNGDGKPDLIVANYADNTVSVLVNATVRGAGTLSFATQQAFAVGTEPVSVVAADVNGDGKLDLIVANRDNDTVSVLLNNTAPGAIILNIAPQQSFASGTNFFSPASVTATDVNGDGKPDLVVANQADNTISVLVNTTASGATTASFAAQEPFATGKAPSAVIPADINNDGKPDLVVANVADNTVSALINTTAPGGFSIVPGITGSWYNQSQSGHGFSVEVLDTNPPQLLAYWYAFGPKPSGGQAWIVGVGPINGNQATLQAFWTQGSGGFFPPNFDASQVAPQSWGTITFTFSDCNDGNVQWDSTVPGYGSGSLSIVRLTHPAGLACP